MDIRPVTVAEGRRFVKDTPKGRYLADTWQGEFPWPLSDAGQSIENQARTCASWST